MEEGTLYQGLLPQTGTTAATALGLAESAAAASAAEVGLVVVFCVSKLLTPVSMSRTLFDRASPINVWKYQPLMVAAPVFFYDVLSLNSYISKYQICVLLLLAAMNAVYRADMWNAFKRKYLLLQTQERTDGEEMGRYQQQLQRKTLLQFLERTSTDDYANMLLETSIGHGTNIRELARDMSVSVWDPSPSSTAAWKLAFSLVTKSLRRQKLLRKQKMDTKQEVHRFIERIVHEMVDTAVDTAAGHGARMKLAGSLAQVTAKRRAVRRLRQHALNRRTLRAQRRAGQLSTTAAHLSTASGTLRSLRHQEVVQIEAAGVASFVVGSRGQVWAFGSNRSMELGGRKEVAQIASAQRMKSVRDVHVVQVSSANSTSGQSHTLVLGANGEVHSFGASNCGALGQGPDVKQSAPLLLRFSAQVPVKMVATGARPKGNLFF
eukprot:g2388.t1